MNDQKLAEEARRRVITLRAGVSVSPQSVYDRAVAHGVRAVLLPASEVPSGHSHLALYADKSMREAYGWLRGATDVRLGDDRSIGDLLDALGVDDHVP